MFHIEQLEKTMVEFDKEIQTKTVTPNSGFMQIQSLEGAMKCAELISQSSFCPKGMMGRPGDIVVALQMGQELGLKPMQALQNIAVINGRPSLWGDAMLAVCRQSDDFEYIKEEYMEKDQVCVCRIKRRNEPEFQQQFSKADAERAGLWGKPGAWSQYPRRMLQMRARGFALRDAFPDLLRGILPSEEAQDMPQERVDYSKSVGITIEGVSAMNAPISYEQLNVLKELAIRSNSKITDMCEHAGVTAIGDLTVSQWTELCMLCERKLIKLAKESKTKDLAINKIFEEKEPVEVTEVETMIPEAKEFFGE